MCGMRSNKREKDVMFDEKRRDVWCKTTCRFIENNVSFCWKQRVVLLKTTCHLLVNVGTEEAMVRKCEKKSNTRGRRKGECDTCDSKKSTSLLEGARTHVRKTRKWGAFTHFRRWGEWETLSRFILFENLFFVYFAHFRKQNRGIQKE